MTDLAHAALDVNQAFLALGHETFEADGATFVRDGAVPDIRDANHVTRVLASTPQEIDDLLARVEREYAHAPHRCFHNDQRTPAAFEARLALDGYRREDALIMILEGGLIGSPKPCEVRPVDSDAAWAAYGELQLENWIEGHAHLGEPPSPETGRRMLTAHRAKSPPVRRWLAYAEGAPRAYFASWEGPEGVGQVEDLFTQKDFRHRGLATALLHHCVADCRAHGAGPVLIVCDPNDTPKEMYAALGFQPVAVKSDWWKNVGRQAHNFSQN